LGVSIENGEAIPSGWDQDGEQDVLDEGRWASVRDVKGVAILEGLGTKHLVGARVFVNVDWSSGDCTVNPWVESVAPANSSDELG